MRQYPSIEMHLSCALHLILTDPGLCTALRVLSRHGLRNQINEQTWMSRFNSIEKHSTFSLHPTMNDGNP